MARIMRSSPHMCIRKKVPCDMQKSHSSQTIPVTDMMEDRNVAPALIIVSVDLFDSTMEDKCCIKNCHIVDRYI